jgi:hypothetical protein
MFMDWRIYIKVSIIPKAIFMFNEMLIEKSTPKMHMEGTKDPE